MKPAVITPRARQDVVEAVRWIATDNPVAARGLRKASTAVALQIGEHPRIGHVRPDVTKERFRFLVLRGFPYLVVYAADVVPPRIVRILHGARDLPDVLADLAD